MTEPRSVIRLQKRPTACLKCGRRFWSELNPEIRGEYGQLLRGERQVFRLCHGCRSNEAFDLERARRINAQEAR